MKQNMTREEIKERAALLENGIVNGWNECDDLIDEIFDYFENRYCINCAHYDSKYNTSRCKNEFSDIYQIWVTEPEEFGCNRFEYKKDK